MAEERGGFPVGIEFQRVLGVLSKQIYETPLAFIRENVQNAVDAIRIQALREDSDPGDARFQIHVSIEGSQITVRDNGTGMSSHDLRHYFWTLGASGKRTQEARNAGCVGTFGIGGFANFGVCDRLEVISQTKADEQGTLTRLSESDIQDAGAAIPYVDSEPSTEAAPRGTVVIGYLRKPPDQEELKQYLRDFARFVPTAVHFNKEKISQEQFSDVGDRENLTAIGAGTEEWQEGELTISGRFFEDQKHSLTATIEALSIGTDPVNLTGHLRFENGPIDVFKRGFKLCAAKVGSTIGVSGRLDCDRFAPTAGRDSLDVSTASLLGRIALMLEKVAVEKVLERPDRIAQHTRIFRCIVQRNLIDRIENAVVRLADGSECTLGEVGKKAQHGGVSVFFGTTQKQALDQVMQARGHLVVILSSDRFRGTAERRYLEEFCAAKPFDGIIECAERYEQLTRFEKVFLSELEMSISKSYEVRDFQLIPGKLTEDIPVFLKEPDGSLPIEIFVDVKHQEIAKLEALGYTPILYSLISTFCREYLGPFLKKWSPRFFGDGALNMEFLAKRRSELWILLKDDIRVVRKGGQQQVVTRSDVQVIRVGDAQNEEDAASEKIRPRILKIVDMREGAELNGFYLRIPDSAFNAYGDLLHDCDSRGVVWAGNRILYVASDAVNAAFQYEVRLDEVVSAELNGSVRAEGAAELSQPLQEMYEGLYFPIPNVLEKFLVPGETNAIRLSLYCDWIDMRTAMHWEPRDNAAT